MFINTHTHKLIYDAKLELVNIEPSAAAKPPFYTYGIHPWDLSADSYNQQLEQLHNAAGEKHCLAIGECGIDKLSSADLELQKKAFCKQIIIANELQKPLIVHCVKGFNELLNCLNFTDNKMPVIIHGFNNNENIARLLVDHGCYFSFGKALLGYDSNAAKALRSVGRKRFFLETDDADISIKYIYHKAAELLGVDEEILREQIKSNFQEVFKIKL